MGSLSSSERVNGNAEGEVATEPGEPNEPMSRFRWLARRLVAVNQVEIGNPDAELLSQNRKPITNESA